ncbi:MAG: universal stress protein [Anaerolineales bacterium]|nr:universal stress protein [Anaerolineales bacterium]
MHILVATGGSTHSNIALQQCLSIAKLCVVEATILSVIEREDDEPEANAILAQATALLDTAVRSLTTKIRIGSPHEEIVAEAATEIYDLLILGEKSQLSLLARLMGPTAQRVIAQTEHPVLLAKQDAHILHRILLCESGVLSLSLVDRLAAQLPDLLECAQEVTLLHVMSQISAAPWVEGQDLQAGAKELMVAQTPEGEWLVHDLEVLQQVEVAVTPKVRHGLVIEEILAEASDGRYDLIVIGAHPSEGWQRFLLEDVAAQIVLKAERPVLVIP